MAREYAQIRTSMSAEADWRDLTPAGQHLYLSILTAPTITHCGVVDWRPNRIAAWANGWSVEAVEIAAAELEQQYMVVFDLDTEEALVRSFIRNDGVMKQPRLAVSMSNAHAAIASRKLQGVVVYELNRLRLEQPDLPGWKDTKGNDGSALRVLEREAIDPRSLPPVYGVVSGLVSGSFDPNRTQGLGVVSAKPPAPTPTPTPETSSPRSSADADAGFEMFWTHYPRKVAKIAARKAFDKAAKIADVDTIVEGAQRLAADPNLPGKDEEQAIPHPASWLNAGRWDDPPLPPRLNSRRPSQTQPRPAGHATTGTWDESRAPWNL